MKVLNKCVVENCIPTSSTCVDWTDGDVEFLGICNGDKLGNLLWEIIKKLKDITEDDLSSFDIDSLIDICQTRASNETSLLNILNVLKQNQICLKDFIDNLSESISNIQGIGIPNVDLSCYSNFDNLGNALQISRDQLDQLVINRLCSHDSSLTSIAGTIVNLQQQINDIANDNTVEELTFATCVDSGVKPTSSQVISVANRVCENEDAIGAVSEISSALANIPATDNIRYGLIPGWITNPENLADSYNNLLLKVANLESRIIFMEENCCAATCKDVELGFSAIFNEDNDGIIIKFTAGAGTEIPSGFTDKGSTGTITDINGNVESFNLTIANNSEVEVPISGLALNGDLTVNITAILGTDALTCQKCLSKIVKPSGCAYCTITNSGTGYVLVTFDSDVILPTESDTSITTTTTIVS